VERPKYISNAAAHQWQERVEWHTTVAWQWLAEIVGEFVVTGSKVYIEGKLQTSSCEDRQSGHTKYRTEMVVRDLCFSVQAVTAKLTRRGAIRIHQRSMKPQ
jgi:single stranded DNA-binding protein